MARYIDANLVNFEDVTDTVCQDQAYEAVEAVPTADVVEVVRCKDCKYLSRFDDEEVDWWCGAWGNKTAEDGFCKWGERREDE